MASQPLVASLMYHEVTDDPASSGFQRPAAKPYKLSRRAFAAHLDQVAAAPVAPARVWDVDVERPGRYVLLTFDDGGKSALHASDDLLRRGWRGHFFIVTELIGRRTFLDRNEIRHLQSCGHIIGSHSHTHPNIFRNLSSHQIAEEWRTSREILSDVLGEACTVASIPGGHISSQVLESTAEAGITHLFISEPWLTPRVVEGCRVFGRYIVKAGASPAHVGRLARFRGWHRALLVRRAKVAVRVMLPALNRRYVQWVTREVSPPAGSGSAAGETPDA
jgi:peptidoglycan/xylan/chitin deacetylase (PgdA/CDA1 family)